METNSHILRLTGSAELQKGLELGKDYGFLIVGSVVKVETQDNQDGTVDKIYKLKILHADEKTN